MNTVIRKRYTSEFKSQVVELAAIGKPVPEVAEEIGIGTSLLYKWIGKNPPTVQSLGGEETTVTELARLRREVSHLKLENDILKKAAIKPSHNLLIGNPLPETPNRAWAGDITFVPTAAGWLYLAVVIDLCSRRVVGWSLGEQYFTPRALIAAIVEVMRPQPGQTICDPACGTGGFLLSAHDYIAHHHTLDREQKKRLRDGTVFGVELVDGVTRLCAMNLLLHGIGGDAAVTQLPVVTKDARSRASTASTT